MIKNKEFRTHKLNEQGIERASLIADLYDELLEELKLLCRDCREFSVVKTKLEEACFFTKKAMASDIENQVEVK